MGIHLNQNRSTELPTEKLTERELEVLKLIARALTNRQIAGQLSVSESTVKGDVSNILSKLQLGDRIQATVYAWQKGLVQRGEQAP